MTKRPYPSPIWFRLLFVGFLAFIVLSGLGRQENEDGRKDVVEEFKSLPSVKALMKDDSAEASETKTDAAKSAADEKDQAPAKESSEKTP